MTPETIQKPAPKTAVHKGVENLEQLTPPMAKGEFLFFTVFCFAGGAAIANLAPSFGLPQILVVLAFSYVGMVFFNRRRARVVAATPAGA